MRMPTERAHGIQIMKTCEALSNQGAEVTLYYSRRRQTRALRGLDPWSYFGLPPTFRLVGVPTLDVIAAKGHLPWFFLRRTFVVMNALFAVTAAMWTFRSDADVYYTRDWMTARLLAWLGRPTIMELHRADTFDASTRSVRNVVQMSHRSNVMLLTISSALKDLLVERGADATRIVVAPDAVGADLIESETNLVQARHECDLPEEGKIAVYTGQLFDSKGADILIESAQRLPDIQFILVGGVERDRSRLAERASELSLTNVLLTGHVSPKKAILYQRAADILLLPQIDATSQSPMKLYEYMAAARPIVASDVAPIREVLTDGENALLTPPGDPDGIATAIRNLIDDDEMANRLGAASAKAVRSCTWDDRALTILDSVQRLN